MFFVRLVHNTCFAEEKGLARREIFVEVDNVDTLEEATKEAEAAIRLEFYSNDRNAYVKAENVVKNEKKARSPAFPNVRW